ncbi:MAG: LTA synthase family protein [Conchiformibius sp.]|nr:LTA synthase family protein [Conchiformibius sp.]
MKFSLFKKLIAEWLLFTLIAVSVSGLGRLYLFYRHTDPALRQQFAGDMAAVFGTGLLFDLKTAAVILILPVLAALIGLTHLRLITAVQKTNRWFLWLLAVLLTILTVCNIFYYRTYGRQFDVFVFGLIEEDTTAVLKTVWADYPVLSGLAAFALAAWVLYLPFRWLNQRFPHTAAERPALLQQTLTVLAVIVAVAAAARGSFGKFPLRQSAANVSASPILNKMVANPAVSLQWAWAEYRNGSRFVPVSDADGKRLFGLMLGHTVATPDAAALTVTTPYHEAAHRQPPNVVLAVMESMSTHLLQFDRPPQRDLLGSLRPHFEQDWLFTRFVSEGDGTSDSLHRLLIRSPVANLSQSPAKNKSFPANMFLPYLRAGYHILFITAGNGAWRNMEEFVRHLGAHEFIDENILKQHYPQAAAHTAAWGIPDEYMFRYAAERLQHNPTGKPLLIMMLSVSHHPPYRLPAGQERYALADETAVQRLSALGGADTVNEVLNTFRYANHSLGSFISTAKQTGNTIIAATGDHNIRGINYPNSAETALGHAVPFYLYAPPAYCTQAVYRPQRVGSHKDIMPTLYELSLSQQDYVRTGCNLTAADISANPWCGYGFNRETLLSDSGAVDLRNGRYYPWQQADTLQLSPHSTAVPPQEAVLTTRGREYEAFLSWLLNRTVTAP